MAASFLSTASTGATSPAVNSSARYSTGIRSASMAANRFPLSSASWPVSRTTSTTGDARGVGGVQNPPPLRLVQVLLVRSGGGGEDPVGVVEHQSDVPQPADAG